MFKLFISNGEFDLPPEKFESSLSQIFTFEFYSRTFSSKISKNKDEFYKICQELSTEVSEELIQQDLLAKKVHLKLKTVNFQVYSRTRSLSSYISSSQDIYNAALFLLNNELCSSGGELRLRLIGIRVSDLKDKSAIQEALTCESIPRKPVTTIDSFFFKEKTNENGEAERAVDMDCDASFKAYELIKCQYCGQVIEGNEEFINQHLDFCFKLPEMNSSFFE